MITSGNHLLAQVKDNQPGLRKSLELGSAGRKPRDCAQSVTEGRRNRHETRRLEVFDAKAWFARTPWEPLITTVVAPAAHRASTRRRDRILDHELRDRLSGSPRRKAFRRSNGTPGFAGIGASRTAVITSATRPSPRTLRASARTRTSRRDCDPSPIICSAQRQREHQKRQMARLSRSQLPDQYRPQTLRLNSPAESRSRYREQLPVPGATSYDDLIDTSCALLMSLSF